jgi:hypothetical protein
MINVNYQKRKNAELFANLEEKNLLFLSETQNYIPIYNRFFSLNDTNFNNINFNNKWYIHSLKEKGNTCSQVYTCRLKNRDTERTKDKLVFFKLAPLLDPYKYMIGKYETYGDKVLNLPNLSSSEEKKCIPKILEPNNSAYVDSLFVYLSSQLIHNSYFPNGLDYYGSFLGVKNNFTINVFDDIDYLNNSDYFNKNKNVLFCVDEYSHLFNDDTPKLKPIKINNLSAVSKMSVQSFDNQIFEDVFYETDTEISLNLDDLKNMSIDLEEVTGTNLLENTSKNQDNQDNQVTLKSGSTCSSRSSHTADGNSKNAEELDLELDNEHDLEEEDLEEEDDEDDLEDDDEDLEEDDEDLEDDDEDLEEDEDEIINAVIPKFPVQVICMEHCENTFDRLIINDELTAPEWLSALMQIIMILITYQKMFHFTHNDLHTNNVMYNKTDQKFIYYVYKKKCYRVPTFGRIFKIIDFGRSIYKFDGKIFCSDSFQMGGDAATQYNTEPYLNDKKPRLEPNYSFDLCRLACSIFDYLVDDISEVKDLSKCDDQVKRIIVEWCLDDNGVNMLYKNNGSDRYPDFKLYKMIARCVHNHTPQAQLERPEFKSFIYTGTDARDVVNIDNLQPCI